MIFANFSLRWVHLFNYEVSLNQIIRHVVILTLLMASSVSLAGTDLYKIGFVNTARVLKEAPQARKVEDRLKAEFEPREAQIREKRKEIRTLEEQLMLHNVTGSANTRRKLEREIRLKVSQLKFLEQEFREDQNLRRNEGIRELQRVIAKVLEKLGDEGNFDLILTEGVSYVSDQIDITTQLVEMLKQQSEAAEETVQ